MGTYWVEPDAAGSARLSPLRGLYSDEPYVGLKLQKSNSSSVTLVDSGLSQNLFLGIFSVGYVYIPVRVTHFRAMELPQGTVYYVAESDGIREVYEDEYYSLLDELACSDYKEFVSFNETRRSVNVKNQIFVFDE